jgi:hypothetical protein
MLRDKVNALLGGKHPVQLRFIWHRPVRPIQRNEAAN